MENQADDRITVKYAIWLAGILSEAFVCLCVVISSGIQLGGFFRAAVATAEPCLSANVDNDAHVERAYQPLSGDLASHICWMEYEKQSTMAFLVSLPIQRKLHSSTERANALKGEIDYGCLTFDDYVRALEIFRFFFCARQNGSILIASSPA